MFTSSCFCQNFKKIEVLIDQFNYIQAKTELQKVKPQNLTLQQKADFHFLKGLVAAKLNNTDEACNSYLLSKDYYTQLDSIDKTQEINLQLAYIINAQNNKKSNAQNYITAYLNYALQKKDHLKLTKAYKQLATMNVGNFPRKSISLFNKALFHNNKVKDDKLYSQIYNNLGVVYNEILRKPDSGLYYLNKAFIYDKKIDYSNGICYNYINQSSSYSYLRDAEKAIELLKKAETSPIREYKFKTKAIIYKNLSRCYDSIKDYKNSYTSLVLYQKYSDSLKEELQEIAINDIQTKYETKEKELENVSLKNKLQTNRIYLFIGFALLLIVILIGFLLYKNISKKKTIAEQEKLIETQKLETSLKEQELHEIDVMLEVQEKERQLIANELHDDLGSMLATLKLNFENLKRTDGNATEKEDPLFKKTDILIEEAYQKVRNIAHLKNLGVIGSEGLVIAVKKMAEKMSVLEKLQINVIPHGLNERLENTLEVMLFRMIQELCTNIIKHSEATEVNIYLTQHNSNELNIIIEDNGKGFDPKIIVEKSGIGLKSIEKKVEQLNGTFTIDSILSKGTTIIIDLPI